MIRPTSKGIEIVPVQWHWNSMFLERKVILSNWKWEWHSPFVWIDSILRTAQITIGNSVSYLHYFRLLSDLYRWWIVCQDIWMLKPFARVRRTNDKNVVNLWAATLVHSSYLLIHSKYNLITCEIGWIRFHSFAHHNHID